MARNKYNVSPVGDRTYKGRTYDSKAEAKWASLLDMRLQAGEIDDWIPQVKFPIGPDETITVDFLVFRQLTVDTHEHGPAWQVWIEEVKGFETKTWLRKRALWQKYGKLPLHVIKRSSTVEVIIP